MRTSFSKLSLFALPLAALTACQDYDPLGEEGQQKLEAKKALEKTIAEYTQNFEERYGKIDPNHDWGMMMQVNSECETRATVDNRNEWVTKYHLNVPGWPDTYTKNDGTTGNNGYHYLNSAGMNATYSRGGDVPGGSHPAGDVTDEEIQYVSWWFRTHRYPSSITLHWTDFFVQGISADNDRVMSGTDQGKIIDDLERYVKDGSGNWSQGIGDDKVTYTIDYFSAEMLQPDETSSDGGWDHIKNYNRQNSNCLDGQETLYVGTTEDASQIYSLNSSNYFKSTYSIDNRLIAFYESSGTENFRAHYSQNSQDLDINVEYNADGTVKSNPTHEGHYCGFDNNTNHRSWVLVELEFDGLSGRHYHGYYLGFDYQIYKDEGEEKYTLHKADGYYSNWIFKLSPATPTKEVAYTGLSRRIMCEDLGNTYDFDFNDVVFDATYNITAEEYAAYLGGTKTDSPIDVTIRLQASGGTLPIWAGVDGSRNLPSAFEAHHLLGTNPSSRPVNVNAPGGADGVPVAIYHYKLDFPQGTLSSAEIKEALSLNRIPIYVQSNGNMGTYLTNSSDPWGNEYTSSSHPSPDQKGTVSAPRAFGVPVGVSWMQECKFIESSYTLFDDWVRDMDTYGDNAQDPQLPWYMTGIENESQIYSYTAYVKPTGNSGSATIDNFDYSQYGTLLPHGTETLELAQGLQTYHYINFKDFPQQPGQYTITIVGVAKNTKPEVQQPELVRAYKDNEGYWQNENSKISGSVSKDTNYSTNKRYIVQFTVDVNEANFGSYTHYLLENIYDKQNDQIGSLYVKRIGDSNYQDMNAERYPEYGTNVTFETVTQNYNTSYYLPLSAFDQSKKYTMTIIVEYVNDEWNQEGFNVYPSDKTTIDTSTQINGSCTKVSLPEDHIDATQSVIDFSGKTIPDEYNYLSICYLNGISRIVEVHIEEITE